MADYILRPGDIAGTDRVVAAGVLVRLSGYIHHGIPFFAAFRPAAEQIDEILQLNLPYLKTGGNISIDTDCVGEDGYITLWNFAKGAETDDEVRRSEAETRALASRILNFVCLHRYVKVRITQRGYEEIEASFDQNEHTLYRWSVTNDWVDFITARLEVPADDLFAFLTQQPGVQPKFPFSFGVRHRPAFDPNRMYKPDRDRRFDWFTNEWNIAANPDCVTDDGYVTLWNCWNLATKSSDEQARKVSDIRTLASRVLNFLCLQHYSEARLAQEAYDVIAEHDLGGWSFDDRVVDRPLATVMARLIEVPASRLPAVLQAGAFNPNRAYTPDRQRRREWFSKELKRT